MSPQTSQEITAHVTKSELRLARKTFAANTNLPSEEVREIIDNIANEFEEQLAIDDNSTGLIGEVTNGMQRQVSDFVANLDTEGGVEVTCSAIETAMSQVTPAIVQKVALRLVQGRTQSAGDVLTANTNLTSPQVNVIVDGVQEDVSRTIRRHRNEASQAVEAAATYTQAVWWSVFLASATGLAKCSEVRSSVKPSCRIRPAPRDHERVFESNQLKTF